MKKMKLFTAAVFVIAAATLASCGSKKGCQEARDDSYDSAATESDSTKCDETATCAKFERVAGTTVNLDPSVGGTYTIAISQISAADYTVLLTTDFGLGIPAEQMPVNIDQTVGTIPTHDFSGAGNGTVQGTVTRLSSGKLRFNCTFAGFVTPSINGTYTDNEQ